MERHDARRGGLAPPTPFVLAPGFGGRPFGRAGHSISRRAGAGRWGQDRMMAREAALQDLARVLHQMKAVGDVFGLWRPKGRSSGGVSASVATKMKRTPGMLAQPERTGHLRPVGQPIDDAMTFEVEEDGAVGAAAPEGKVIDAYHAHGPAHGFRAAGQQTHERLIGDRHAQGRSTQFGTASAQSHPQSRHLLDETDRLARPWAHIV
jgi:hypothetical protein